MASPPSLQATATPLVLCVWITHLCVRVKDGGTEEGRWNSVSQRAHAMDAQEPYIT